LYTSWSRYSSPWITSGIIIKVTVSITEMKCYLRTKQYIYFQSQIKADLDWITSSFNFIPLLAKNKMAGETFSVFSLWKFHFIRIWDVQWKSNNLGALGENIRSHFLLFFFTENLLFFAHTNTRSSKLCFNNIYDDASGFFSQNQTFNNENKYTNFRMLRALQFLNLRVLPSVSQTISKTNPCKIDKYFSVFLSLTIPCETFLAFLDFSPTDKYQEILDY